MSKTTINLHEHLEFSGHISAPGSAGAIEINTELTPDCDAVPGQVSGDAFAFTLAPTINISPHSVGPIGGNSHKWVGTARVYMPRLKGGGGTGKPQSLVGFMLLDPPGVDTTQDDALMEAWAIAIGTKLPIRIAGLIQVGGLRVMPGNVPTCSNDPEGKVGDIRWDENHLYIKTGYTWKRTALETW